MSTAHVATARQLWALYEARSWAAAEALFATDAVCDWPATCERFTSAKAIIQVNAAYPEGWAIRLLDAQPLLDGRVLTLVRVDHGAQAFWATSFFAFESGLIAKLVEYWADCQPAPAWREGLTGRSRLPA